MHDPSENISINYSPQRDIEFAEDLNSSIKTMVDPTQPGNSFAAANIYVKDSYFEQTNNTDQT